jgi:hypothetical protein
MSRTDVRDLAQEPPYGVDVVTSDDKTIKASTFVAPYSYIKVWVLDPKTLDSRHSTGIRQSEACRSAIQATPGSLPRRSPEVSRAPYSQLDRDVRR